MSAAAVSSLRHLVLVLVLLAAAAAAAVQRAEADDVEPLIGLDYGSEWIKVAVAQGASVDIVLNENTQRKSLAALSFPDNSKSHDELRLFGESAMARPHLTLQYIRELLGQPHNRSNRYGPHQFPDSIQADPERGVCRFIRSAEEAYSAEELNAMLLSYIKELVHEHTGKPARRCVISVPAFFADSDRRALLSAAKISGLEVVSLVNDGLAVAIKYATDNLQLATFKGVHRVLFFDMGATATQATVVEIHGREAASPSSPPSAPLVRVLGAAWDSSLGGAAFTNRLVDLLAKACLPQADLRKDARAMARLRKEAGRAKHVLSANKETTVTAEDIMGDYDVRQHVKRAAFEEHCSDLLDRVFAPVSTALQRAGNLTLGQLDAIELVGGGWRVPSVQEALSAHIARSLPLGKTLNADEASCSGAAILALYLTRAASARKTSRAAVSPMIEDVVPHDVVVMIDSEFVAVMPAGKPLLMLGSGQASAEAWAEDEEGFTVIIPVATSKDFDAELLYSREPGAQPFAVYRVTGLEAALAAAGGKASGKGGAGGSGGGAGYDGGGGESVELHVKVSRDGTVELFRAVFLPPDAAQIADARQATEPQPIIGVATLHSSVKHGAGNAMYGLGGFGPVELSVSNLENLSAGAGGSSGKGWGGGGRRQARVKGMDAEGVKQGFAALQELERMEYGVKRRDEKCNFLEASIYTLRDVLEKEETAAICSPKDMLRAEEAAQSIGSWLEANRQTSSLSAIESKIDDLEDAAARMYRALADAERLKQEVAEGRTTLDSGKQRLQSLRSARFWLKTEEVKKASDALAALQVWLNAHPPAAEQSDDDAAACQRDGAQGADSADVKPPAPSPRSSTTANVEADAQEGADLRKAVGRALKVLERDKTPLDLRGKPS